MSVSTRSEFVDFIIPLRDRLKLYDRSQRSTDQAKNDATDKARAIPQGFIDAMTVREQVYVDEQKVPLENELDEDDERSFHWVAYASIPVKQSADAHTVPSRRISMSTKIPIGTIRLVPPPHPAHAARKAGHKADTSRESHKDSTIVYDGKQPYVKLSRLAVIPEFRKAGISRLLIETALAFAKDHPHEMVPHYDPTKVEALRQDHFGMSIDWKGLVLVHAQVGVQKVWRKYGFETDESMGTWDEEGIDHVGMWRRLEVSDGRRKSKAWLPSSP